MPRIFISYRRADSRPVTERIHDRLVSKFGVENVFLDVERGNIPEGQAFRDVVLSRLYECDVLLIVIGKKWLDIRERDNPDLRRLNNSDDLVRTEVRTGLERAKNKDGILVIPLLVSGAEIPSAMNLPEDLQTLPSINARVIRDNPDFHDDMTKLIERIQKDFVDAPRLNRRVFPIGLGAALLVIAGFIVLLAIGVISLPQAATPTFDPVVAANSLLTLTKEAEVAAVVTATPNRTATIDAILTSFAVGTFDIQTATANSYTNTPTNTPAPTDTPTANRTATTNAQATASAQAVLDVRATSNARTTNNVLGTRNAPTNTPPPTNTPTLTPTLSRTWTPIPTRIPSNTSQPTINRAATANAQSTQTAQAVRALDNANATLNAQNITATHVAQLKVAPTPTIVSVGLTNSTGVNVRSGPGTNNSVVETLPPNTLVTILEAVENGAWFHVQLPDGKSGYIGSTVMIQLEPVDHNADWQPMVKAFDGVDMVLVPRGCFDKGNEPSIDFDKGLVTVTPVPNGEHICLEKPYWLDKNEVSNLQFARLNGIAASQSFFPGDLLPREKISRYEAEDFCKFQRGGRLPTDEEWEYAARGPDNLIYPWGNIFVPNNVVYLSHSPENVGNRVGGKSWVGALDMIGNVWEWTTLDVRGGSYSEITPAFGVSSQSQVAPSVVFSGIGFRCVRDYEPK